MTADPLRLSDDPAGPELARALRRAQGDVLSPDAVARVRSALHAAGVAAAATAGAGSAAATAPLPGASGSVAARLLGGSTSLRVGLAIVGLAVGVAGASRLRALWHEEAREEAREEAPPAPAITMGGDPPYPPPQAITPAPPAAVGRDPRTPATGVDRDEVAPPAASAPPAPGAETQADAPPTPPPKTVSPKGSARPHGSALPSPREGALLLEARRMLGTQPARALALIRAHEAEFPESQLAPERARIAAEARRRSER